jgi:hypothetical protein
MSSFDVRIDDGIATVTFDRPPINGPATARELAKASMNQVEGLPLKKACRIEQAYAERLMLLDDEAEAHTVFFERPEPEWKWR